MILIVSRRNKIPMKYMERAAFISPTFTEMTVGRKWSLKICMELDPIFLFIDIYTLETLSGFYTKIYMQICPLKQCL